MSRFRLSVCCSYERPVADNEAAAKRQRRDWIIRSVYVEANSTNIMVPVIVLPVLYRVTAQRSDSQYAQTYQFHQAVEFKIDHEILLGCIDVDMRLIASTYRRWKKRSMK
jgi:hypothetical protein